MKRCPTDNWKPGESMVIASVDPPQTLDGGVGIGTDALATDGGISGFTNRVATAWDVLAGRPECVTDLQDFLNDLNESPDLRAAATLRSLTRIRTELERIPEHCELSDPVVLKVQDVVLLARQLMSRLR